VVGAYGMVTFQFLVQTFSGKVVRRGLAHWKARIQATSRHTHPGVMSTYEIYGNDLKTVSIGLGMHWH
jgi:hypothetical protein